MRQIKDVKLGDHVCLAFAHEAEQRAVVTAFLAGGLESRERVLYFKYRRCPARIGCVSWLEEPVWTCLGRRRAPPGVQNGSGELSLRGPFRPGHDDRDTAP
ncbi:hypothetical protein [Nonomuraea dietziae]|uniref:hypothetical protein n=1 Tax=Nonomuraea dietziae TaxID=65515 RepID=UPI0031D66378